MKQRELFDNAPPPPRRAPLPSAPSSPKAPPAPTPAAPLVPPWKAPPRAKFLAEGPQDNATLERQALSVSALTQKIKEAIDGRLSHLWVKGEVANYKGPHARGHLYFSLKDETASLDVKMWASQAKSLRFRLEEGMSVLAMGTVEIYAPTGRYSLVASHVEPEGLGAQALAFQQLKKRLAQEGLWGPNRKRPPRPLPFWPRRIGIVTSVAGAALKDFLKVLLRRHPRLCVLVRDARVQGPQAAAQMAQALKQLYATDVDVVVLARGGGSAEDLAAFNEEALARTVFESPVPIVSAVGHETDIPLCDLVADLRAPTPSAAAELLSPVLSELELQLALKRRRLKNAQQRLLALARAALHLRARALADPRRQWASWRLQLAAMEETLQTLLTKRLEAERKNMQALSARLLAWHPRLLLLKRKQSMAALQQKLLQGMRQSMQGRLAHQRLLSKQLNALSPLAVLSRGYVLLKNPATQKWLLAAEEVVEGQTLEVHMAQGRVFSARVTVAPTLSSTPNMPKEEP